MRQQIRVRNAKPAQRRGRFIVIDGADGSGKTTQIQLLARRLRRAGYQVVVEDFPQYRRSVFGPLIGRMLTGEFGAIRDLNPYLASLPYSLDRSAAAPRIKHALARGTIVLANRFTSANLIHQGSKFTNVRQRQAYQQWVQDLEFRTFRIPRPDCVLFLDVPTPVSQRLLKAREYAGRERRRRDRSETDVAHQAAAYRQAIRLATTESRWQRIPCTRGQQLLSRGEIAARVWQSVQSLLPR